MVGPAMLGALRMSSIQTMIAAMSANGHDAQIPESAESLQAGTPDDRTTGSRAPD